MNFNRLRLSTLGVGLLAIFALVYVRGLVQDQLAAASSAAPLPTPTDSRTIHPVHLRHSQSNQTNQSTTGATSASPSVQSKLDAVPQPKPNEENRIFKMTNLLRKQKGKSAFVRNDRLDKAARAHAMNMAKQGIMNHVLDGKPPSDRIKSTGYVFHTFGENIANAWGRPDNTNSMFNFWLNSPPHLANILGPFTEVGIGVAVSDSGQYYACQVFAGPVNGGGPNRSNPKPSNSSGNGRNSDGNGTD